MLHIDYRYLRPKKAAWLKTMYDAPLTQVQELAVWTGRNATILPLREVPGDNVLFGRGGVVDEDGQYVSLSGIETRILNSYPFESPVYRDVKAVYCGYLVNHWGHFLVEAVTRLWYVLQKDPTIDKYVFFLNENEERIVKGNYKEFFVLLDIWDKLELVSTPTTYRELVVPQIAFHCPNFYSPMPVSILPGPLMRRFILPAAISQRKTVMSSVWILWMIISAEMDSRFWLRNGCLWRR